VLIANMCSEDEVTFRFAEFIDLSVSLNSICLLIGGNGIGNALKSLTFKC
jgi:hypothetical protein